MASLSTECVCPGCDVEFICNTVFVVCLIWESSVQETGQEACPSTHQRLPQLRAHCSRRLILISVKMYP